MTCSLAATDIIKSQLKVFGLLASHDNSPFVGFSLSRRYPSITPFMRLEPNQFTKNPVFDETALTMSVCTFLATQTTLLSSYVFLKEKNVVSSCDFYTV